jgi:uncharacterized membrane protein YqjE
VCWRGGGGGFELLGGLALKCLGLVALIALVVWLFWDRFVALARGF